tara:strand:+ start:938 stop:1174 length:237 start_codon:yes stop_codon:yes gene_type:complete
VAENSDINILTALNPLRSYCDPTMINLLLLLLDNPTTKSAMAKKGSSNLERYFDRRSFEVPKREMQCSANTVENSHAP